MPVKPLPPPRFLKKAPAAKSGGLEAVTEITDGKTKALIAGGTKSTRVNGGSGEAYVGASMGITIPGPPKTYLSARIDTHVYLPSGTSEEEMSAQLERCKALIQKSLEEDANTVEEFFNEWMKSNPT